ncbi:replication initiator protein A [Chloroflexi bacterium TSY]|nr:replication initiator protein A [Chloroflexi bacterium TSY]
MSDKKRRSKDEMNLAVLPIARLGPSDKRTSIEYHGTFVEDGEQKEMVWIVEGGALGLPTELAERVLIALLYIGAQDNFRNRKMTFTMYRVLKILGLSINARNYREVEKALDRLVTITIFSDQAWFDREKKNRITTKRRFHIIDESYLHYEEGADEGNESYIVWGNRVWRSIQSGYLKYLDLDFYYSLKSPLSRRMFRFLDKTMAYNERYEIDIFALQNKLGMAIYEYPSHLKRALKKAAQELVDRDWLVEFEFVKIGKYHRIIFYKKVKNSLQLLLFEEPPTDGVIQSTTDGVIQSGDPETEEDKIWQQVINRVKAGNPQLYDHFQKTRLIRIENGIATIEAGQYADWMQNRLVRNTLIVLNEVVEGIADVSFVRE